MKCGNCGHTRFHDELVTRTFFVDGRVSVVQGIPALICERCGDATFDAGVADQVRRLVHEPRGATRTVPAELLYFEAA